MNTHATWADVREAVKDLHKTLDLVQRLLNPEPERDSPLTGTIFDEFFGKK